VAGLLEAMLNTGEKIHTIGLQGNWEVHTHVMSWAVLTSNPSVEGWRNWIITRGNDRENPCGEQVLAHAKPNGCAALVGLHLWLSLLLLSSWSDSSVMACTALNARGETLLVALIGGML
jgi:hypothetical protein